MIENRVYFIFIIYVMFNTIVDIIKDLPFLQ